MTICKKCGGKNCTCKKTIHELAKANPDKTYKELEKEKAEQKTYEHSIKTMPFSGEVIVDDTNDCEWCG